jgi:hypothetical protein
MNETNILEKIGKWVVVGVAGSIIVPIISFPLAALDGWVISKMWGWFVMPLFAVPALHVWMAVGLAMTARLIKGLGYCEDKRRFRVQLVSYITAPLFVLLFGWIIHRWLI